MIQSLSLCDCYDIVYVCQSLTVCYMCLYVCMYVCMYVCDVCLLYFVLMM